MVAARCSPVLPDSPPFLSFSRTARDVFLVSFSPTRSTLVASHASHRQTGKTSVALALCRQLYDPSQIKRRVLELNASDERGISVVRDKIKHFASLAVGSSNAGGGGGGRKNFFGQKTVEGGGGGDDDADMEDRGDDDVAAAPARRYPNPPFKIIILDEADTVTRDAQAALRRVIEAYSKVTRFILICNYVTRIIEPLASRCAKFRFAPLPVSSMRERIMHIATEEGCRFDEGRADDVVDEILSLSQGDMRRAVTTLQSAHSLSGGRGGDAIKKDSIAEMAGLPPPALIDGLIGVLRARNFDAVREYVQNIVLEGYSAEYVLSALMAKIIALDGVSDQAKAIIAVKVAEADKYLIDGSDETLQLLAVCSIALEQFKKRN
jgi:replication factor C subunit 2/4